MNIIPIIAAVEPATGGGLSALGLNVQSFFFQLITFVIVLVFLRKFVYGRLVDTLEARRTAVLESLAQADESAKQLEATGKKVAVIIKQARVEAEGIVSIAHKEATKMVEDAEEKATKRAEHVVANAEARLAQDITEARVLLRKETARLVADATEKIIRQKLDSKADAMLIDAALKEAK